MEAAPPLKESTMSDKRKARAIGFNHVALEVGDIDEAIAFYGRLFDFKMRSRSATDAFIDLGDQFLALQKGRRQPADDGRHFGLVLDDKEAVKAALKAAGVRIEPGPFLDFLDPWEVACPVSDPARRWRRRTRSPWPCASRLCCRSTSSRRDPSPAGRAPSP